jgi:hypothetical protein
METLTVQVEPDEETALPICVDCGFKLSGSFFIVNETEPAVVLAITAPNGTTVVSLGAMEGEFRRFAVMADEGGNYTLHFKNMHEPSTPQTVRLTYTVTGPYLYGIHVDILLADVGIVLLIASAAVLVVFLQRRGRTKNAASAAT